MKDIKTPYRIIKGLQNLYSWSEFYKWNKNENSIKITDLQIEEYKKKHNLH